MNIDDQLEVGELYSRNQLSELLDTSGWGFDTGVFIPKKYDSIWLFITEEKTSDRTQYHDLLRGDVLEMDGQKSGRTDSHIINHKEEGKPLLLFYRKKKTQYPQYAFRYEGPFEYVRHWDSNPAHFILKRTQTYHEILQKDIDGFLVEHEFIEGGKSVIQTSRYERNPQLRAAAIDFHGTKCMVCNFDFEKIYGLHGAGYIEVHHLIPVSESRGIKSVDPRIDMAVVCSNCHRMIHRRKNHVLSVEKLKEIISVQQT